MRDVKDIRITDPYVRRRVEAARQRAGESTMTRTAARLILERLAQLEVPEPEGVDLATSKCGDEKPDSCEAEAVVGR